MDGKNSFLLYRDLEPTIAKLADDEAGKLFKHLLAYVNDKDPTLEDRLLELVFEPIKQSLKRDLKKREWIRKKRAEAWKLWGKAKLANASKWKQSVANVAVSVSDSVSDNDSGKKKKSFSPPPLDEVVQYFLENWYSQESAEKAWKYYDVGKRKDSKGNNVKNWKQKMISVWFKEENETKEITKDQYVELYYKMWHVAFRNKYGAEKLLETTLHRI